MKKLIVLSSLVLLLCASQGFADTFTVTNCASSTTEAGSLPWAVSQATTSGDIIQFNITTAEVAYATPEGSGWVTDEATGAQWFRIVLSDRLVLNTSNIQLIGTTQPTNEVNNPYGPEIELRAPSTAGQVLIFQVSNIKVSGLIINIGASGPGYLVAFSAASGSRLFGCYVGCDATGEASKGSNAGIYLASSNSIIIGGTTEAERNIISGNLTGIQNSTSGLRVLGNYIGVNRTGTRAVANSQYGIVLDQFAPNCIIGSSEAAGGNVISGNGYDGLYLVGSNNNIIMNNIIGLSADQTVAIPNGYNGINIENATGNEIGRSSTMVLMRGNIIAGNNESGIYLNNANDTKITSNAIGCRYPSPIEGQGNQQHGISIVGSSNVVIGGLGSSEGNMIVGNGASSSYHGIQIGSGAANNRVAGNLIGIVYDGIADPRGLGNKGSGVRLVAADGNCIGGATEDYWNQIGSNEANGIELVNASNNQILGNIIGSANFGPEYSFPNQSRGIYIWGTSSGNEVGSTESAARNTIGNNVSAGIEILDDASGNEIFGNYVGVTTSGEAAAPNNPGIKILGGNNIIGGSTSDRKNVISGNKYAGVYLFGTNCLSNEVYGNYIGTNVTGMLDLGNTSGGFGVCLQNGPKYNKIGGATSGQGNLISGNDDNGIYLDGVATILNQVKGNKIGTDINGTGDLGNTSCGIAISNASGNIIGGSASGAKNIISGNNQWGIYIAGSTAVSNEVKGNYIGLNINGDTILQNNQDGVNISGASYNIIGGTLANEGNVISGNAQNGIYILGSGTDTASNEILGNYIGTDKDGTLDLGNTNDGIKVMESQYNRIGNGTSAGRNLISGNNNAGVHLSGNNTASNEVLGNYIGPDINGTGDLGNVYGLIIESGASYNKIGGVLSGQGNVISGSGIDGITVSNGPAGPVNYNEIAGNLIGVTASGEGDLGNDFYGIRVNGPSAGARFNRIGPGNVIAYNGTVGDLPGILITEGNATQETITQNSIYENHGRGIALVNGGNNMIPSPEITSCDYNQPASTMHLTGTASQNAAVEVFGALGGEGAFYVGTATADASGNWEATFNGLMDVPDDAAVTATQTDVPGNTSEFCPTKEVTFLVIHQPDAAIAKLVSGTDYAYIGTWESVPVTQVKSRTVPAFQKAVFYMKIVNAGTVPECFRVSGEAGGGPFTVRYFNSKTGTNETTPYVTGEGVVIPETLEAGASMEGRVEITYSGNTLATKEVIITASSTIDANKKDVIKASATFTPADYQPDGAIATLESGNDYATIGIYESVPVQQVRRLTTPANQKAIYYFKVLNAGVTEEIFSVSGEVSSGDFTVRYFDSKTGTNEIIISSEATPVPFPLSPGVSLEIRAEVTYSGSVTATKEGYLTIASSRDSSQMDVVKGITTFLAVPPVSVVDHFIFQAPATAIAGQTMTGTLTAYNAAGIIEPNVTGTTYFTVDKGLVTPESIPASEFQGGIASGPMSLSKIGLRRVTAKNGSAVGTAEIIVMNASQEYTNSSIPGLKIEIPAGATTQEITISASTGSPPPGASPPPGFYIGGDVFDLQPDGTVFLVPVTVTIPFTGPIADPHIYYWNGTTWSSDGITLVSIDTVHELLTFTTTHFTPFAPMGALGSNQVRFGPNPYNPNSGSNAKIWYWLDASLVADTSIYIVDLTGTLVWKNSYNAGSTGAQAGANSINFDGKDRWGNLLGDGLYIYKIVQGGKSIGGGKIAIIKK
ncbi:MAG: hypothetical protein PHH60_01385 [Candidatus Margulisbacteria bacterium]|nr:hypothetical protein [Candidatus Margulisiibacteriota bacterium]